MRSHFSLPLSSGTLEDCSLPCAADNQVFHEMHPLTSTSHSRKVSSFTYYLFFYACCNYTFTITSFLSNWHVWNETRELLLHPIPLTQVPVFFDKRHRRYLRFWTGGWAVACCVCALFTITTFLVDLARFAYPVRPILYMAMCYLMISIVYMIGEWSSSQCVFIYILVCSILW